jgi:uncharacterized protein
VEHRTLVPWGSTSTIRYIALVAAHTAAELLREARTRSGLTQAKLAERAGVQQSVVSIYEAGRRQPALATLSALVAATGYELDVRIRTGPAGLARLRGPVGRRVLRHRNELMTLADRQGVRILGVFGSVARGQDRHDSDVDLLVDLPTDLGLLGVGRLEADLERLLEAPVDLVPATDLKPDVRRSVDADLVIL